MVGIIYSEYEKGKEELLRTAREELMKRNGHLKLMSRGRIVVGCCGFPVSMKRYVTRFNAVEVQSTFYRVHERKTLERWRRSVPKTSSSA